MIILFLSTVIAKAHCDTMDGPVVADARKALETGNAGYALKWVKPDVENEAREAFALSLKVRGLNEDAKKLADRFFFETIVRLHRQGEGIAYTGIKPSGTPVDEKIKAADLAISTGDLSPLKKIVPAEKIKELTALFEKALALKSFDINNVEAGRKYVEAYVSFFHFAEGEESVHGESHNHD